MLVQIVSVEPGRFFVTVRFDDERCIYIRKKDVSRFSLVSGLSCDLDNLTEVICAYQLDDAYESALSSLDICARTEKEIRERLSRKGYLLPVIESVCERLKTSRLIDDRLIAEKIVAAMGASGKGKYAIVGKLRARGISDVTSDDLLNTMDSDAQALSAYQAAKKLWSKYDHGDSREAKKKLSQALARRGFTWDSIETALERIISDNPD